MNGSLVAYAPISALWARSNPLTPRSKILNPRIIAETAFTATVALEYLSKVRIVELLQVPGYPNFKLGDWEL